MLVCSMVVQGGMHTVPLYPCVPAIVVLAKLGSVLLSNVAVHYP